MNMIAAEKIGHLSDGIAESLLNVGAALGEVKVVKSGNDLEEKHFLVVPEGFSVKEVDFEKFRQAPIRNVGVVVVSTVESFLLFSEREFLPGTTVCFADQDGGKFEVVFNYAAGGDQPGWSDRSVILELKQTTSWARWMQKDKQQMDQLAFADFIEENMPDISEPTAADIVEMIQQLKVHRKAEFVSVVDPKTGFTNLTFNEQISGETLKGNIEFSGKFVLGLAPYRGSDKYRVDATLRFNITDQNKLRVFYSMLNADLVEEHAFAVEREKVLEKMKELGVPVFDI